MDELKLDIKKLGIKLLKRDILYNKIPKNEIEILINFAIKVGKKAGQEAVNNGLDKNNPLDYVNNFCEVNKCNDKPNIQIYSETIVKKGIINIYCSEIDNIYKEVNIESINLNRNRLYNVFILHEFFHILEDIKLGYISKKKEIVVFKFLNWEIKRGISQLSEISANSFIRTIIGKKPMNYICNR